MKPQCDLRGEGILSYCLKIVKGQMYKIFIKQSTEN
ncbi:hypothetical protein BACCAP_02809 [Pseudoflavonifractor capillosus ATCC 29799]|uniref:Uncharacterized protein n=1 Tax=Pseudoflavonifractor capillosus ATCC 29799 TaxID=411467 RepID=A6NX64_9FIRM|nr:hypothetical protein BACCAP_02809 [Pseudoflavonifractor capillosus ATCC 29799]